MNIADEIFGHSSRKRKINSKRKGNNNERLACVLLQDWTGYPFARVPSSGGLRWKNMASVVGDLVCTDEDVRFSFVVETKFLAQIFTGKSSEVTTVLKVWAQAEQDCMRTKSKVPLLLLRDNGMQTGAYYVIFSDDTLKKIGDHVEPVTSYVREKDGLILHRITHSQLLEQVPATLFIQ
jgi:hypothetical protein